MALIRGWRFLDSARINRIVRTLADELEAVGMRNLIGLQRTPIVNADEVNSLPLMSSQMTKRQQCMTPLVNSNSSHPRFLT